MRLPERSTASVLFALFPCSMASAQSTERVSVATGGAQGNSACYEVSISADGRYVAFSSDASNLVANDLNATWDIFVRDRLTNTTERVSVGSGGSEANAFSYLPAISADGRFVAFYSEASNLVSGDTNATGDIFVRDRVNSITERVSVGAGGAQANNLSTECSISGDGRFVAFSSWADNLASGDSNGTVDIFVRDRLGGTTECVSRSTSGAQANGECSSPSISADGNRVAFISWASNLVAGDINSMPDVFLRDRQAAATERVSVSYTGGFVNGGSDKCTISADGLWVAFYSTATNLVAGDTNQFADIFVRDLQQGTTLRVSVDSAGAQGSAPCYWMAPALSANGRFSLYCSAAGNLVPGDTNGKLDVFLHDSLSGTTERVSLTTFGAQANNDTRNCALCADGRFVAFSSRATNLVAGDTNQVPDVFVRDRWSPSLGTDLCQPGSPGVLDCPCLNPPSGAPRGCENSSFTGGARLFSEGAAALASDSVVFLTLGEKPTAMSILLQGDAGITSGTFLGQGVLCVGGTLRRLYTKVASAGAIRAPESGDASVSARSAALGDTIAGGSSRWYAVYYHDPIVLGFCAPTLMSNVTQTERIDWGP